MEYKKKLFKLVVASGALSVVSFFLSSPIRNGLCRDTDTSCARLWGDSIGMPLFFFSITFFLLSLAAYWLSESVFRSWLRFAKYYLPVAALIVTFSPTIDSSIFGFDKEFMTWLLSGTFFIVSLAIIIYKWFRQRGE